MRRVTIAPTGNLSEERVVASRINRAVELLAQDQAIYCVGAHTGHVRTRAPVRADG
jgi:hypothetical protein